MKAVSLETKQRTIDEIQSGMQNRADLANAMMDAHRAGDFKKANELRAKLMETMK